MPRRLVDKTLINYNESNDTNNNINHPAWDTDPDANPYHPVHFDGSNKRDSHTKSVINISGTDADYLDDDTEKPALTLVLILLLLGLTNQFLTFAIIQTLMSNNLVIGKIPKQMHNLQQV